MNLLLVLVTSVYFSAMGTTTTVHTQFAQRTKNIRTTSDRWTNDYKTQAYHHKSRTNNRNINRWESSHQYLIYPRRCYLTLVFIRLHAAQYLKQ